MCVRLYSWNAEDIYRFYNLDHKDYPDLPPPPNPRGLKAFMFACVNETVRQKNAENDPKGSGGGGQPERRRI